MSRFASRLAVVLLLSITVAGCGSLGPATATEIPTTDLGPTATQASTPVAPTRTLGPTIRPKPSPTSSADAALQALVDNERTAYGAPGAMAALLRAGHESFAAAGMADLAGTPITRQTRFRIASITKSIVASLVLRQVAHGTFSLDDVVGDLLPGVLRANPPVTVRQILSHTSGIFDEINQPDIFADIPNLSDPAMRAEADDIASRYRAGEQVILSGPLIVALSETHDRYFAPGSGYHYSNTGYQLAAMILEKTTGQPLSDLVATTIVQPLGLQHTSLLPPDTASPEFRGYAKSNSDSSLIDVTDDLLIFGNGGPGGIITTPQELLTMMRAIVSGRLLPAALVAEMEQPIRQYYGLGIGTYGLSCGTFFGHEGGTNGTASIALVSPNGGDGVVLAVNLRGAGDPNLVALADRMLCKHL